jgi:glycosyltransferase involved in cell wall biosynthesis
LDLRHDRRGGEEGLILPYRICVISYRDMKHPEAGGAEVIIQEVMSRLAARGHAITLLTGAFPGGEAQDRIGDLEIHRTGNTYTFNFAAPAYFKKHLEPRGFDLVVEDINKIPFFMPRHTRVPVLAVVPHLFGTTVFEQAAFPIAAYVYLYERFIPKVYRNCLFSVLSETTRDDLIARGFLRESRIIHSGIDHDLYRPGTIPVRTGPAPRLPRATQEIQVHRAPDPSPARGAGAGAGRRVLEWWGGDYRPALERIARRLGWGPCPLSRFIGEGQGPALTRIPSPHLYLAQEGWGLSVIEAGACATPVVASNSRASGNPSWTARTASSSGMETSENWGENRDPLDRRRAGPVHGREGLRWAATFHWDASADQTWP